MTAMTADVSSTFQQDQSEAFAGRMLSMLNEASLSMMISIGHRTGLFDTMGSLPPSTSQRIADAADLQERYVREWLGAMVTGIIVRYEPDTFSSVTTCAMMQLQPAEPKPSVWR